MSRPPHSQNGIAERAIHTIMEMVRTFLADSALPLNFWGETFIYAVFVYNRMSSGVNPGNRSPFEIRFGRQPDLHTLHKRSLQR